LRAPPPIVMTNGVAVSVVVAVTVCDFVVVFEAVLVEVDVFVL